MLLGTGFATPTIEASFAVVDVLFLLTRVISLAYFAWCKELVNNVVKTEVSMGLLKIEGVTHWSIPVNDLTESEKFYGDLLGQIGRASGRERVVRPGGSRPSQEKGGK